jgi:Holliday junction resolvase
MAKRVSDEACLAAYAEHKALKPAAEPLGICPQSLHARLTKLGAMRPINVFTDDDRARLERDYALFRDAGRLRILADEMGRTVPFLSRQAGALGLTDRTAPKTALRVWRGMERSTAEVIWDDFKRSSLGMCAYCRSRGYDDVGFSRTMRAHFADEWEHVLELKVPRESAYRRGRAFEYAVRKRLQKSGYFVVRSSGSRSPVDLVAFALGAILFVQCKRNGALGVREWNELYELSESVEASPIIAERTGARGIRYWLMEDRKDGSRRRQPMREVDPGAFLAT